VLHHFHRGRVVGAEAGKNKKARPAHMTNRACNLQQKTCPFTERTGNFLLVPGTPLSSNRQIKIRVPVNLHKHYNTTRKLCI
jgi:hypothetical protein